MIQAQLPFVIERLMRCASRSGVVSHKAFALEADRLGLTTEEQRRRLSRGLADVGIRVRPSRAAQAGERSAPISEPGEPTACLHPRVPAPQTTTPKLGAHAYETTGALAQARRMVARYADESGAVSRLARDGVARLHGLGPAEARALAADFPLSRPISPSASTGSVNRAETRSVVSAPAAISPVMRGRAPAGRMRADEGADDSARLAGAVRAAREVLEADRWRRNAAKVVLKADEEVGLAVLLRGGVGPLGRDVPEAEVAALPRDDERWRAYECFVVHNQRLVWKVAQGYQGHGLDIEDLVQHGNIGLLRAIRKFDATKGYKFSTYATWWLRQAATRAIADEGTLIRIPVHVHETVSKVSAAERKLLSEGRSRSLENVAFVSGLTFDQVEKARRISRPTDSLDRVIGDDAALGDLIIGPSRLPGPLVVVLRKEFQARLRHVLGHLSERERHVLIRRAGLDGDEPDTLESIAVDFSVTRERIRQIELKAKTKFRDQATRHGLAPACG